MLKIGYSVNDKPIDERFLINVMIVSADCPAAGFLLLQRPELTLTQKGGVSERTID